MIDKSTHPDDDIQDGSVEKPKKTRGAGFALFLAFIALFFTALGIAVGYHHWQRIHDKVKVSQATIDVIQEQLQRTVSQSTLDELRQETRGVLETNKNDTQKVLQDMARMQNQTRQFADTVTSQVEQVTHLQARMQRNSVPNSKQDWQLAEVEYLLRTANREIHLSKNTGLAIRALKAADKLLAQMGAVNYLPVRQQITRDLSALEAVEISNMADVAQQIMALMLQIKPLPANESHVDAVTQPLLSVPVPVSDGQNTDHTDAHHSISKWDQYRLQAAEAINKAVVVRRADKPFQHALDRESRQSLYQLLQVRLETLRLMALQRQDANYQAQIALIRETISGAYPETTAQPLLEVLDDLATARFNPTLPDATASLRQLESARQAANAGGNAQ